MSLGDVNAIGISNQVVGLLVHYRFIFDILLMQKLLRNILRYFMDILM